MSDTTTPNDPAKEARRDLSHVEIYLQNAGAPSEVRNRTIDIRSNIVAMGEALTKINAIRNSIIGIQKLNWSEHVYPLVAALDAAGYEGMGYPEARKYFGGLLERAIRAEDALAALTKPDAERRELTGAQTDTLIAMIECGPLEDGDEPSKRARDELIELGYAMRVQAIDYWRTAATHAGVEAYKAMFGPADTLREAQENRKRRRSA